LGAIWESLHLSKNLSIGIYGGDTVIIDICLQVAYYMGFKEVYLLGCDCDYSGMHRFDGLDSENKNAPSLIGDFSRMFESYQVCKDAFEKDGRKIINATEGGHLEVFQRKSLKEIFD